jgi:hypothetical protein
VTGRRARSRSRRPAGGVTVSPTGAGPRPPFSPPQLIITRMTQR